jgi:hypothetical protein
VLEVAWSLHANEQFEDTETKDVQKAKTARNHLSLQVQILQRNFLKVGPSLRIQLVGSFARSASPLYLRAEGHFQQWNLCKNCSKKWHGMQSRNRCAASQVALCSLTLIAVAPLLQTRPVEHAYIIDHYLTTLKERVCKQPSVSAVALNQETFRAAPANAWTYRFVGGR